MLVTVERMARLALLTAVRERVVAVLPPPSQYKDVFEHHYTVKSNTSTVNLIKVSTENVKS